MTHYPAHSKIYNIKADSLETSKLNTVVNKTIKVIKRGNMNPLSGLLSHYDSDSEHEEPHDPTPNKLDAKVDDFLQEINKIVPNDAKTNAWQQCFDETTGYPYYWNVETNVVTWEMPEEYKKVEIKPPDKVVPTINRKVEMFDVKKVNKKVIPKRKAVKNRKKSIDSDDEKIVMITSFSESSSESDSEIKQEKEKADDFAAKINPVVMGPHIEDIPNKKEIIEDVKDENIDETIILARLRTQAKVLHELGGELPKSLDKSIISDVSDKLKPQSLALVAGYGDDSEPEEEPTIKSLFPISTPENLTESQSTLFPVSKPIDVKQFEIPCDKTTNLVPEEPETDTLVDNKVFKRKKRLGIVFDVVKPEKKLKIDETQNTELESERKGFGFNSNAIKFVKADTLNPVLNENEQESDDIEEIKEIVNEKVKFLGEGKDPVSAVQVMAIQLQTLELAFKAGGLTKSYLLSWLRETFVDLKKLEQEAAPEGWQCQWDRSNKRYSYRNVSTGEWQWEFPADIVGGGDAMDICTTPPPNEDSTPERRPSPPKCSPTPPPPPPPIISPKNSEPPIPSASPPLEVTPPPTISEEQPLPPGVDSPDLPFFASKTKEESSVKNDSLGTELDSFYSDIAMLEATTSGVDVTKTDIENVPSPSSSIENTNNDKKKKKLKSKLGQGSNMKKKAVSTLVEKWKKVQNDYL